MNTFTDDQINKIKESFKSLKSISADRALDLSGILDQISNNKEALTKLEKAGIPALSHMAAARLRKHSALRQKNY